METLSLPILVRVGHPDQSLLVPRVLGDGRRALLEVSREGVDKVSRNSVIVIVWCVLVAVLGAAWSWSHGQDFAPRVEGQYTHGHAYRVTILRDGTPIVQRWGVDTHRELIEFIRAMSFRHCTPAREYDDIGRLKPAPSYQIQVWDTSQGDWIHPGGKAMPAGWDGLLPLVVVVKVGSTDF